jgi:eukaryotic-like serine/threonine-protein kinase
MAMPQRYRLIEPRGATPPPGGLALTSSFRLPDDLVAGHLQRLSVYAAVGAALWTYGLVMETIVNPLTDVSAASPTVAVIEAAGIALSAAMFLYVRFAGHSPETKSDVALPFMVLNAMGVAFINTWARTPAVDVVGQVSWNAVVILVSSMMMSTTARRMLVASLIAATTDPLGVWIAHLYGMPVPSAVDTLVYYAPNYACAFVAAVPSHVLQRLGRRLRHVQEMGSYHLVEMLGRGGMGEVWRARHRLLARDAAIKLVRPELLGASTESDARTMLLRFEREAQATAALSSPHTIQVFDFGVTRDRTFYYVMELLTGRDLDSLVRQFGPLSASRTLFLLRQICHSLADAHARGLVHRDVTPSNVYACRMGIEYDFVKVLDFGLVTFDAPRTLERTLLTGAHMTTGTPAYMAPEVILERAVDQRADVYAVGCVAYFLLTGQLVFEADTPMKMFIEHLQAQPIPPSQRTELPIPREVDELVLACLEKDPAKRPQDAEALLRAIDRCAVRDPWDHEAARQWWEQHLPELTRPLGISADRPTVNLPRTSPDWRSTSRLTMPVITQPPAAFTA